ncbi:MAG: hypothetical protein ACR2GQ_09545 [Gemmatimonadota bacterium]
MSRDALLQRFLVGVFGGIGLLGLALAVVRAYRSDVLFNYAEGIIAGSLAAQRAGGLAALYPSEWAAAPLVLTLYPPGYFLTSGALSGTLGSEAILLAPRLVSLVAAVAAGIVLVRLARRWGADPSWFVVLLGAALVHPGVYRQLAAAQTDMLALGWTMIGVWFVLGPPRRGTSAAALACFAMAAFTKQSFVAAPLALLIHRVRSGDSRSAARDYAFLGLLAVPVVLLLQSATDGGFLRHVLGAVVDSGSLTGAGRVLRASRPELWVPLVALVAFAVRGRLRVEFPELWLGLGALLHGAATMKTGASVNYFLEPLTALIVVGLLRSPRPPWAPSPLGTAEVSPNVATVSVPAWNRWAPLAVLLLLGIGGARAAASVAGELGQAVRSATLRLDGFAGGTPLVGVDFFPSLIEEGGRPYLNDPFAFGALAESGTWDPAGLRADLEARRVPFVITDIDIRPPISPGDGVDDLLFAYFWRLPGVREPLLEGYADTPTPDGFIHVWRPRPLWRPSGFSALPNTEAD